VNSVKNCLNESSEHRFCFINKKHINSGIKLWCLL